MGPFGKFWNRLGAEPIIIELRLLFHTSGAEMSALVKIYKQNNQFDKFMRVET